MTMTLGHAALREQLPELNRESLDERGAPRGSAERVAIMTLTAAFIFQPILHPSGPSNSSPVDLLVVLSIVAAAIWARSGHHKLRAPYFIPVALFVAAGAASGLVGPLPGLALTSLVTDILLFAWCTVVVNVLSNPRAMRYAMAAWSWSGVIWAAVVVCAWLGHITPLEGLTAAEGNRVMFTFGDPNYAATYWTVTIFVVYSTRTPSARWMRVIGYVLLAWALVLTESNGGVLAVGAAIFFLLLLRSYRKRGLVGSLATALVIVLAVGGLLAAFPIGKVRQDALNSGQPLLVNSIGRSGQSTSERGELDKELMQLYNRSDGFLGLGPMSTKPVLQTGLYPYPNEAHNDFLAALTERGAIGLLGLLLLTGTVIWWAAPLVRRPLSAGYAAAVPRPAGLVAALLALASISYYEEVLHFRFLWALFGIVAILGKDARR
jgi:hypothetical protein